MNFLLLLLGYYSLNLILALYQIYGLKIFSPTQCPLLCRSFLVKCNPTCLFLLLLPLLLVSYPKKSLFTSRSRGFFHMFSSRSLWIQVSHVSVIYFELIFCVWCKISVPFHPFAFGYPIFPIPFVEETYLFLIIYSWHLCWSYMNGFLSWFSVLFH